MHFFILTTIIMLLSSCFPPKNKAESLTAQNQTDDPDQSPRPKIADLMRELKEKSANELSRIVKGGPLEERDLVFLFGAATTLEAQRTERGAEIILFFARDADPFFDAYCAQQVRNPIALASAKRFFLNMDLYRDKRGLLRHIKNQGIAPGRPMIWLDTGYGGSNFSYLLKELVELGRQIDPQISPIQIVFPILPFLVASSGKPSWEREMGLLRESSNNFSIFINDVFYPEILIPQDQSERLGSWRQTG